MRVAIVHYWLLKMRGGEKVVEALCRLFPAAELFTLFYDPEQVSPIIRERKVTPSFLNRLRGCYRSLLPLMPMALEHFDLRGYDLVITSESGPAKGVLVPSAARHICYCHTPMRYLWELYPAYLHEWTHSSIKRAMMAPVANYLRLWDYASAARVDTFIANSETVKRRIWRTYRRNSEVIHPPVSVETFYWRQPEDYFLAVSELSPYKRLDTAVRAFSHAGKRLRIVGTARSTGRCGRWPGPDRILRMGAGRPIAGVVFEITRARGSGRRGFRHCSRGGNGERKAGHCTWQRWRSRKCARSRPCCRCLLHASE